MCAGVLAENLLSVFLRASAHPSPIVGDSSAGETLLLTPASPLAGVFFRIMRATKADAVDVFTGVISGVLQMQRVVSY